MPNRFSMTNSGI